MTEGVSLESMERAASSLEDFCRSNLAFHGLDIRARPADLFRVLPTVAWVEALIYQLDAANEAVNACTPEDPTGSGRKRQRVAEDADPFAGLRAALGARGLMCPELDEELRHGAEYWALERALTADLKEGRPVSRTDVERAMSLKSFDYRVMTVLVYRLLDKPVNPTHFAFLKASEVLVDIADDLFDYEEDVLENAFNCFRFFVHMHGPGRGPIELAQLIEAKEEELRACEGRVEPELREGYRRRCEEAVREGGGEAAARGAPGGRWSFPSPIVDEAGYRQRVWEAEGVSQKGRGGALSLGGGGSEARKRAVALFSRCHPGGGL